MGRVEPRTLQAVMALASVVVLVGPFLSLSTESAWLWLLAPVGNACIAVCAVVIWRRGSTWRRRVAVVAGSLALLQLVTMVAVAVVVAGNLIPEELDLVVVAIFLGGALLNTVVCVGAMLLLALETG